MLNFVNMLNLKPLLKHLLLITFILITFYKSSQSQDIIWANDGSSYFKTENNQLVKYTLPVKEAKLILSNKQLTPPGKNSPLALNHFSFSNDQNKILIFTNTTKVWRLHTKGDYWIYNLKSDSLYKLGKTLPSSSLMFAKFSPDSRFVAYVCQNNIYAEDLTTSEIRQLTGDGSKTLINGTFDWVYEEEFNCRDGFRWSGDSKSIAFWQIDAGNTRRFNLINNTDSVYPQIIPIEYPTVGEKPSKCRIGVINIADKNITWINIPGDPRNNYIVKMEFIPETANLLVQQLNRKQNDSRLYITENGSGNTRLVEEETDSAWIDLGRQSDRYNIDYANGFTWINNNKSILWSSEKDGWRHLYQVSLEGKPEKRVTNGDYDIIEVKFSNPKSGYVYFTASPQNATQQYLYRTKLNGKGSIELLNSSGLTGFHDYDVSPTGRYSYHTFTNHNTKLAGEFISMVDYKPISAKESILARMDTLKFNSGAEFFTLTTCDNIQLDGWMVKPTNFDPSKKYPVVFYVYSEPAASTVHDLYTISNNRLYRGNMADDGYIYVSVDNRGSPSPKGRAWRKSIYRKIGNINIHDQAMAAREILKWPFVDPERVAVWGWSGGGSATLNLMFQYPDIYRTGIAIAALCNLLSYDNVYQERYMGLASENLEDYISGSPVTYAKNLKGNLLYIHGTGDDNVHYQNAEMLINELVKYNRQFQFMAYPNRTHSLREGEGTYEHLSTLYTNYLKTHCPPGPK